MPKPVILVVGHRWSPQSYELKDFLQKNLVPYRWVDVAREENVASLNLNGDPSRLAPDRLPFVAFPDGSILEKPTPSELAEKLGLKRRAGNPFYEIAIVGGGPAGLAAAVYASSEGIRALLIEKEAPGGQAGASSKIENYLGFPAGLTGADLTQRAVNQAKRFGTEILSPLSAQSISLNGPYKVLHLSDGTQISCQILLLATGVAYRKLSVPGADHLLGSGVYYGMIASDANYCEGETAVVVGGGNSAGQAALFLTDYAQNVLMLVRGDSLSETMSSYLIDQLEKTRNFSVRYHSEIIEVSGEDRIRSIKIRDTRTREITEMDVVSIFVYIGAKPRTEWLEGLLDRDQDGFILTGPDLPRASNGRPRGWIISRDPYLLETNVPGIFAAGDVRYGSIKRIASAVGEGAIAVTLAHQYLSGRFEEKNRPEAHIETQSLTLQEMSRTAEYGIMTTVPPEEPLYVEGETSHCFYIVLTGELRAFKRKGNQEELVAIYGPNEFTGDIGLQIGATSTCSVRPSVRSTMVQIEASDLRRILADHPELGNKILRVFTQRWSEPSPPTTFREATPPPAPRGDQLIHAVTSEDHTVGAGGVEIVVYGDYQCPFTWRGMESLDSFMEDNSGVSIQYTYRHFPQSDVHPDAELAARAAEAAHLQGRFWDFHHGLLELRGKLPRSAIDGLAQKLGLDLNQFGADLESEEIRDRVREHLQSGAEEGVDITPTLFLEGKRYTGQIQKASISSAILRLSQKRSLAA